MPRAAAIAMGRKRGGGMPASVRPRARSARACESDTMAAIALIIRVRRCRATEWRVCSCALPPIAALLLALPAAAAGRDLPAGFVYLRDVAPRHRAGHPLRHGRQFHRPPAARLWGGRMRAAARGCALALARVPADLARDQLGLKVYDCYRPHARGARLLALVADGATAAQQALLSACAESANCSRAAISPRIRAIPPAPRSTSRWWRCRRRRVAPFDPRQRYGPCTAPAAAARARQFARHGHRLRLPRREELHRAAARSRARSAIGATCSRPP